MPIYDAHTIPEQVGRGALDPELAAFLKTAPSLGAHEPVHVQRASHDALIAKTPPPIGHVEHLGLPGPHGTIPVRCYHASAPGPAEGAALIYLHGGGWTVGTLDQFDAPMRLFAERSGAQVYAVDYKLAPEHQWPVQIEEAEYVVRWLADHGPERGVDPARIALGGDSARGLLCSSCSIRRPSCRSRPRPGWRTGPGSIWKPPASCCLPGT